MTIFSDFWHFDPDENRTLNRRIMRLLQTLDKIRKQDGYEVNTGILNCFISYYNFAKTFSHTSEADEPEHNYCISDMIFLLKISIPRFFLNIKGKHWGVWHRNRSLNLGCVDVRINKTKKSISVRVEDAITETADVQMFPIELVHELSVKVQERIEEIRDTDDTIFECGYFQLEDIENRKLQRVYNGSESVFSILDLENSDYIGTLINCALAELDSIFESDNFIEKFGLEKFMERSSIMYIYKLLCSCKWWKNNKSDAIKSEYIDYAHDDDFLNEQGREIFTAEKQMFSLDLLGALAKKFDDTFYEMKKGNNKQSEWADVLSSVKKKVLVHHEIALGERFEQERKKEDDGNQKREQGTQVEGFWDPDVESDGDYDGGNISIWPV